MTIFDHAWVQASFGQKRENTTPTMKDYILGSEEFLIKFYELLETKLATCDPLPGTLTEESQSEGEMTPSSSHNSTSSSSTADEINQEEEDRETTRRSMDYGLTAHNRKGRTDLHFVNDLIADIMKLHSIVDRTHREKKEKKLTDISKRLYHLRGGIKIKLEFRYIDEQMTRSGPTPK